MSADDRAVLVVTAMDGTADSVITHLNAVSVPVARFDLSDVAGPLAFSACWTGERLDGTLDTGSRAINLRRVRSLYYRRPTLPPYPGLDERDKTFALDQVRRGFEGVLGALPGCLYVNHPRRQSVAEYKPAQLEVASSLGFCVPATLITNRVDDVREFGKVHGPLIYKALAWSAYAIGETPHGIWTREVDPSEVDETVSSCPHLFQAKVDKIADVRVTVVGGQVFCARIDSPLLDWREDYDLIESYTVVEPPTGLADRLQDYLDHWGLVYGCFDFGIDRDGTWWFFECNPSGEWGWIEHNTGMPISTAFADILRRGIA